jgi:hypothetical protein
MIKENESETLVRCAYAALVLRGFNKASEIHDPILVEVWKLGRKLAKPAKAKTSRRD